MVVEGLGGMEVLWGRVFLWEIFYRHNVVGGSVNCTNDIYGGRTHSACRYGCVQIHIKL